MWVSHAKLGDRGRAGGEERRGEEDGAHRVSVCEVRAPWRRVFEPSEFQARANVHVVGSAPHATILPLASAVIAHGGHGTVIKALAGGVPVLCIPLGRDQGENATRTVETGAGLALRPSASAAAIAGAVRRLLDEPAFRAAARAVSERIRAERQTDTAVEALEALGDEQASVSEGCNTMTR
jgi:UDP:flavonoid glycosyltransferase YjiC (YdhE family)